jgi:hypothetical protein
MSTSIDVKVKWKGKIGYDYQDSQRKKIYTSIEELTK